MNKLIILIIALFLINHCSFNENSRIWKEKEKKLQNKSQIKKVFSEDKKIVKEFNPGLKLKLENVITNNKIGAAKEDWFKLKGKDLIDYMSNRKHEVCDLVENKLNE